MYGKLKKSLETVARYHHRATVFTDWIACCALAFSNAVDKVHYEAREEQYMQIVKGYEKEDVRKFPDMLAMLVECFEKERNEDWLGKLYAELELAGRGGQFFTPYHVSHITAGIIASPEVMRHSAQENGFVTMLEPSCGAGGMCIAFSNIMDDSGLRGMYHITGIDISIVCVHMAYVQLTLLDVPAVLYHGNTLSMEMWDQWKTARHIMGLWDFRFREEERTQAMLKSMKRGGGEQKDNDICTPTVKTYTSAKKQSLQMPTLF